MSEVYLNHAGTSWPKPPPVGPAMMRALEAPPGAGLEAQAARVAAALGSSPTRLLFTPGCTAALHLALADLPWRPNDVLLLGAFEHLALERPARALAARGVKVELLHPGPDGAPVDLDRARARLARGGVRAVAVSAAVSVTGALMPVDDLAALAWAAGARLVVDAAQAVGWWPLQLDQAGWDLVGFGAHKGTQGPWGIGALHLREGLRLETPRAEGPAPRPSWCDAGTLNGPALAGWAAALDWLDDPVRRDRLERARDRVRVIQAAFERYPEVRILGPRSVEARVPTVAVAVERRKPAELAAALRARGVIASAGLQCAPLAHRTLGTLADGGALRLSAGPETSEDEARAVEHALSEVLGGR